ncbi:hypothetical protein C8R44DRAFT_727095 [Mycena epipterygia]|nr:hypothetical protein C8R44DRAFT_727095 [Mycena epipterygia]
MYEDEEDKDYQEFARAQHRCQNEGNDERSDEDEDTISEYNNGKDINYLVAFQPQLPPLEPNEKTRRSNAHALLVNCSIYMHENSALDQVLDAAIKAVGLNEGTLKFKIVGKELRTDGFTITWTIARTLFKKMQLASEKDFSELIQQVTQKAKVEVKLEAKLDAPPPADGNGDAADRDKSKGAKRPRTLTAKEEEIAETIVQLQNSHRYSDQNNPCSFDSHSLHYMGIGKEMLGVTLNTPPGPDKEKMFWPVDQQPDPVDDIALLAARRRGLSSNPNSSVTINNDFAGFTTLFQPLLATTSTQVPLTPTNHPISRANTWVSPAKPAHMTMTDFCHAFKLSNDILQRLEPLELDGPHVLDFLKNAVLDQYLKLGQGASLRYAQDQWKKGKIGI